MREPKAKPFSIKLLNKTFEIQCPMGCQDQLLLAAQHLNHTLTQIRDQGRVIGLERMAIMAALNLSHELLTERKQKEIETGHLKDQIEGLQKKIDRALMEELET